MSESSKTTMKRLDNLEKAMVQVSQILVDQSERMDAGFRGVREEIHGLREDFHGLQERMDGVTSRLDRLIEVTIKERTVGLERLLELERRVARLEERSGL